jgi:hypothetical protein
MPITGRHPAGAYRLPDSFIMAAGGHIGQRFGAVGWAAKYNDICLAFWFFEIGFPREL